MYFYNNIIHVYAGGSMGKMVSVMLSDREAMVLENYCTVHGISKSEALRLALRSLLEKRKVESKFKKALIKGTIIKEVSVSSTKVYIVGDELEIEMLG